MIPGGLDGPLRALRGEILARGDPADCWSGPRAVQVLSKWMCVRAQGQGTARSLPRFAFDFPIEFDDGVLIGRQNLSPRTWPTGRSCASFWRQPHVLSLRDVEAMRASGRALGGTLANAVVVDGGRVLTPGRPASPGRAPSATRCWMRWEIWRSRARRSLRATPATVRGTH